MPGERRPETARHALYRKAKRYAQQMTAAASQDGAERIARELARENAENGDTLAQLFWERVANDTRG